MEIMAVLTVFVGKNSTLFRRWEKSSLLRRVGTRLDSDCSLDILKKQKGRGETGEACVSVKKMM